MNKVLLTFDMSGHAYDPDNPTKESEKLCYKLNSILDAIKDAGIEIRQKESQDIIDSEAYIAGLFDQILEPPEAPLPVQTPVNVDMLFDKSIYESVNKARVAWLLEIMKRAGLEEGELPPEERLIVAIESMEEVNRLNLNKEEVLFLSDGTPIYGKTGLVA